MMMPMSDKIATLWPEMILLIGACGCLAMGLSGAAQVRRATGLIAAAALLLAGVFAWIGPISSNEDASLSPISGVSITTFIKLAVSGLGLLMLLVTMGAPQQILQAKQAAIRESGGAPFEPGDTMRGEFFAFFLLSLTGVMLCAGAEDLVWLFLALELTSLPTYVMVATTRDQPQAREAAVKYFFLGAMAAAVFLYGFTLIYGATGSTQFAEIRAAITSREQPPTLFIMGLVLSILGVSFKIAAAPMHFYAADVYQGAASPVTAFLAIVPKTAGFVSLIGLLGLAGFLHDDGYQPVVWLLWGMAAATMTIGNVLGLLQQNVKRLLAYSSVAHSGYMLVGLIAASSRSSDGLALGDGIAGVLFYLIAYSLATLGAFAVLGCVEQQPGQEAQTFDDIAGLGRRHPLGGVIMLVSVLSLVGLPPLVGFIGKIYLFGPAIQNGYIGLVVIAVVNSAISAVYYLRIVSCCYFSEPNQATTIMPMNARWVGAGIASLGAVVLGFLADPLIHWAHTASPPDKLPINPIVAHAVNEDSP